MKYRAAQTGGILESFLDYHSIFGARSMSESGSAEQFVKIVQRHLYKTGNICYIIQKRGHASLPHERSDLYEVYVHLQENPPE